MLQITTENSSKSRGNKRLRPLMNFRLLPYLIVCYKKATAVNRRVVSSSLTCGANLHNNLRALFECPFCMCDVDGETWTNRVICRCSSTVRSYWRLARPFSRRLRNRPLSRLLLQLGLRITERDFQGPQRDASIGARANRHIRELPVPYPLRRFQNTHDWR